MIKTDDTTLNNDGSGTESVTDYISGSRANIPPEVPSMPKISM
jgi:hypothetical protein